MLESELKSSQIAVLTVFSWTFNSLASFLIDVVESFLIGEARAVKSSSFRLLFNPPFSLFLKNLFFSNFFCFIYGRQRNYRLVSALSKS